ncbi:hypothetical protein [Pareuzebyella sediminis]|uniref:hypothetical protein n=1 Tax=Pareuzebyella sediminis TaxID=2607998 RepID=UPI0011ED7129|nr:hypothetical protein [Pareuzebyella sediminis]
MRIKKLLIFSAILPLALAQNSLAQEGDMAVRIDSIMEGKEIFNTTKAPRSGINNEDQKISFIAGVGASYITNTLYQNPVVDLSTKNVIISKAQSLKTNISLGIAYTPQTLTLIRTENDEEISVPYGWTFISFINPLSFNQASDNQGFFNMIDFGIGLGWKFAGDFLIVGTLEFFNVRQAKEWFIEEYEGNDKSFSVDDAAQVSFDSDDNNIFRNKMATTIGFKICYTFDIIKSYKDAGETIKSRKEK